MKDIGIVIAVYNGAQTIEKAIESALVQRVEAKILILDAMSNDGTQAIVEKFGDKVEYIRELDKGLYDAWNKAVRYLQTEFIFFLNCDDAFFSDDSLYNLYEIANSKPDAVAVHGKTLMQHPSSLQVENGSESKLNDFLYGMKFLTPATLFRRDIIVKLGGFDMQYKISSDYEFAIRLYKQYERSIYFVNVPISCFSLDGMSNSQKKQAYDEISRIIAQHFSSYCYIKFYSWNTLRRIKEYFFFYLGKSWLWKFYLRRIKRATHSSI